MKFSREHLKKLAAKGKGGLAKWAAKQLSGGGKSRHAKILRRSYSTGGAEMRHRKSRGGGFGGGGGVQNLAVGAAIYGFAARSVPTVANLSPLVRLAGAYFLARQSGITGNVAKAAFAVEAFSFAANAAGNVSQIAGGSASQGAYL